MRPKILLVNPPIYDFAAYDFWLKPCGMLTVAGYLRDKADFTLFDYLDRLHPFMAEQNALRSDRWGRGRFHCKKTPKPQCLKAIPRYYQRFGLPPDIFKDFLTQEGPFDFAFVQTTMTYWYQGVQEVIEDIRGLCPQAKIILGGNYVMLCAGHAQKLGADFLVEDRNLDPLWKYLGISPEQNRPALWEAYGKLRVGVLKLADGCPFNCTYCSVPKVYGKFKARPLERSLTELKLLCGLGVENVAFYDDALLFEAEKLFVPFLNEVIRHGIKITPLSHGGGHEFKLRSGTENVPGIVGFAKSVKLAMEDRHIKHMTKLRDKLTENIEKNIPDTIINGPRGDKRLCNNVNMIFKYVEGESIGALLDAKGISSSTGSACSSHSLEPSHVLIAIGRKPEEAHGSLRLTLSRFTTEEEIDKVSEELPKIIEKLRKISPFARMIKNV